MWEVRPTLTFHHINASLWLNSAKASAFRNANPEQSLVSFLSPTPPKKPKVPKPPPKRAAPEDTKVQKKPAKAVKHKVESYEQVGWVRRVGRRGLGVILECHMVYNALLHTHPNTPPHTRVDESGRRNGGTWSRGHVITHTDTDTHPPIHTHTHTKLSKAKSGVRGGGAGAHTRRHSETLKTHPNTPKHTVTDRLE